MTNYEWLVKNDKLEQFVENISVYGQVETKQIYGIPENISVAEWLRHEYNLSLYVRVDDVLILLRAHLKDKDEELYETLIKEIFSQEWKEIEE